MQNLIKNLPEVYQDIIVKGELVAKGKRDCETRWKAISPFVQPHGVVLDIGSAEGYFTKRIAQEFPDSLVISFECDPLAAAVQRKSLERDGIYNVVLCERRLTLEDFRVWVKCVECIDVVLALSVLHHFPAEHVEEICGVLGSMARTVVTEVPGLDEDEACGGEAKSVAYDTTIGYRPLCDVKSHLGDYVRSIRCMESVGMSHVGRKDLDAYRNFPHEGGRKFCVSYEEGGWTIGSDDWTRRAIQGVNVWNIFPFNIIWPPKRWWKQHLRAAYMGMKQPISDVRLWNCLVTSSGIKAIDYMYPYPQEDQAAYHMWDIKRLEEEFDECIV